MNIKLLFTYLYIFFFLLISTGCYSSFAVSPEPKEKIKEEIIRIIDENYKLVRTDGFQIIHSKIASSDSPYMKEIENVLKNERFSKRLFEAYKRKQANTFLDVESISFKNYDRNFVVIQVKELHTSSTKIKKKIVRYSFAKQGNTWKMYYVGGINISTINASLVGF